MWFHSASINIVNRGVATARALSGLAGAGASAGMRPERAEGVGGELTGRDK
jgi:hypothetical protein